MRNLKFIHIMVLNIAAIVATSCGDMLDLAPIDNYGSTSYWKQNPKSVHILTVFINNCEIWRNSILSLLAN